MRVHFLSRQTLSAAVCALGLVACGGGGSSTNTSAVTVPGAPTIGAATAGNASASIAFSAPASNGGASITGYTATCVSGSTSSSGTGTSSPIAVSGLANGTVYNCSVTASNSAGYSASSSAVSVTPTSGVQTATVPGAPTIGVITPGNASVSIAFNPPVSVSNSVGLITGYTATCVSGSTSASGTGTSSPIAVSGLANGTVYNCSVTASNSAGTSAASGTVAVTPTSGGSTTPTNTTAGVLCSVMNSGNQVLSYTNSAPGGAATAVNDTLAFSHSWSCSSSLRSFTGNGVPNHAVTDGKFATKLSAQSISGSVTLTPVANSASTPVKLPGYALNSVKMDPGTAGTCTNTATSVTSGCDYAGGNGTWRMEAMGDPAVSPWKFDFGTDVNNAHVQPNGQYHYHGMPTNLIPKLNNASTTSMTLVAWAADGFPIYANYGYSTANNASSALKEMKGSYLVKSSPDANRPSVTLFAMGHFQQDWVYAAGQGDLDECNGRTGVTPEFPQGVYHYYVTKTYPFIQRCVKGSAASWAFMP